MASLRRRTRPRGSPRPRAGCWSRGRASPGWSSARASPGYHFLVAGRKLAEIARRERPDGTEVGSPYLAPWLARRAARGTAGGGRLVAFVHENPRLYTARLPWLMRAPLDAVLAA